ncbi:hypothetical protein PENTCL1PPCAC_28114, partial [Pristionchus entomophagus]
ARAYEHKFLLLAFLSFVSTLPLTVHQLIRAYAHFAGIELPEQFLITMFAIIPWFLDLKYFADVHLVIVMNPGFRKQCIYYVKKKLRCLSPAPTFRVSPLSETSC